MLDWMVGEIIGILSDLLTKFLMLLQIGINIMIQPILIEYTGVFCYNKFGVLGIFVP